MQQPALPKKRKNTMDSFWFVILFIVAYLGLQYFVLPKLGVPT